MSKKIVSRYAFQSKSNPGLHYETLRYSDGTLTCNCPGWTRHARRVCKHTSGVQMQLMIEQQKLPTPMTVTTFSKGKETCRKIRYEEIT